MCAADLAVKHFELKTIEIIVKCFIFYMLFNLQVLWISHFSPHAAEASSVVRNVLMSGPAATLTAQSVGLMIWRTASTK